MSDLIEREDAINEMAEYIGCDFPSREDAVECARSVMGQIPSARPKGEWIEHEGKTIVMDNNFVDFFPTEYECSNCGLRQATYFINSPLPNYCPNCGSDNREREGE